MDPNQGNQGEGQAPSNQPNQPQPGGVQDTPQAPASGVWGVPAGAGVGCPPV